MSDRFGHINFDEKSKILSIACKHAADKLEEAIESIPFTRSKNNSLTRLEECIMWINKALREAQIEREGVHRDAGAGPKPTLQRAVIIKKA